MQRSLIDYRASQDRVAVLFQCDGQTLKPARPLITQMAFDPDLINIWLTWIRFWVSFARHCLAPIVAGHNSLYHLLVAQVIYRQAGMDVYLLKY